MKKIIGICVLVLLITGVLVGCEKKQKVDKKSIDVKRYTEIANNLSDNIHSSIGFDLLQKKFDKYKNDMTEELYNDKFDLSKLEVKNMYRYDYPIAKSEIVEVFVEKLDKNKVNVIVLNRVEYKADESIHSDEGEIMEPHDAHENSEVYMIDIYRFKDGKMYDYVQYW